MSDWMLEKLVAEDKERQQKKYQCRFPEVAALLIEV
jgi:hypothetical protein